MRTRLSGGAWLSSATAVALLLSVSSRYGFHRDELYFIVAGRNLDWGFVDQPPLTPAIARLSELIGGTSPVALRILPALAIGLVGLLAASIAKRLGGGPTAQTFAAFASAWTGVALAFGHLLATATFDYLFWTLTLWIVVSILDGADRRWWIAVGAVVGVGLMNKHLIIVLAVGLLVGILATRRRSLLASPWPWTGVVLAAAIAAPNLIWQATHEFPQLEMSAALAERSDGALAFAVEQIGLLSVAFVVPAAVGAWRLLRDPGLERWRPLGITFGFVLVAFWVARGKSYYLAPMYPLLMAAAGGWFEELADRPRRVMQIGAAVGAVIGVVIALPVFPPAQVPTFDATGELAETIGWQSLVDQVGDVADQIPADLRANAVVLTVSYGEAAAIDVLGADEGLPPAASGHNSYWLWGPPAAHGPVIGVGPIGDTLDLICDDVLRVGTVSNRWDVPNETNGYPLLLCPAPRRQLSEVWDQLRHYN